MRDFYIKTLIFFFPILLFMIFTEVLLRNIPKDYSYKRNYLDKNSDQIQTLILGSSHTFYGLDPIYFDSTTFNAAHISQTLDYDYEILKKYINKSSQLKNVIVPISYFSLYGNLSESPESWRIKNYIIYYNINTHYSLKNSSEFFSLKLSSNLRRLYSFYVNGIDEISCSKAGWGIDYKSENAQNLIETGKSAALEYTQEDEHILDNIIILKSIITLCRERNIRVVLFTPPAFETYRKNLNAEQLNTATSTAIKLALSYKNCIYLNLLDDKAFVAKDFYDADHLSEIGAKKLSIRINDVLSEE